MPQKAGVSVIVARTMKPATADQGVRSISVNPAFGPAFIDAPAPDDSLANGCEIGSQPAEVYLDSAIGGVTEMVDISSLVRAGSPRSQALSIAHVKRLVETDCQLPPILVHRPTMRVIDGFHRVAARESLGYKQIEAYVVDVSSDSAFVLGVEANIRHGLPLSLSERRAAAAIILRSHAHWSDRAIAGVTGLSAKTVRGLRCAAGQDEHMPDSRLGRDGRRRPRNPAAVRGVVAELLTANPGASLREIAATAGVSPGTVRNVKARLSQGEEVIPGHPGPFVNPGQHDQLSAADFDNQPNAVGAVLSKLSKDPALRMNAAGRKLLHWLHTHAIDPVESAAVANLTPDHCVDHRVELATRCSTNWAQIADELRQRSN